MFFVFIGMSYGQKKQVYGHQDIEPIRITEEGKKLDIRIPIMKAIASSWNGDGLEKINKDALHIMSVGVSFNDKGGVDSVYLSKNLSVEIQQVLKPGKSVTNAVREMLKPLKIYKNLVVVFPVLIFDGKDDKVDSKQIKLAEFTGIWPKFNADDIKKPVVLLDPFFNGFKLGIQ